MVGHSNATHKYSSSNMVSSPDARCSMPCLCSDRKNYPIDWKAWPCLPELDVISRPHGAIIYPTNPDRLT